jgi:O-antigen biosynthesis protein
MTSRESSTTGTRRLEEAARDDAWRPIAVVDVDLADVSLDTVASSGPRFIVARLHTRVLGVVVAGSPDGRAAGAGSDALLASAHGESLRAVLLARFADQVRTHVERWGCDVAAVTGESLCQQARARALADAPTASVVVATRERPELLRVCVESLLAQAHPAVEILVVDNAPVSDATQRLIRGMHAWRGRVRYLREDVPGLGRAHNAALPHVQGDVVAITDDDVVADRFWLSSLLETFVLQDAGCVTGPIVPLELRTREQSWVEQYGGFTRGFTHRLFSLAEPPAEEPLFPFTAGRLGSGANMAFTRAALDAIGGFDPSLGAGTRACGGDDLAAFAKTALAGARIAYCPDAVVRHRHHADYEALRRMSRGYGVGLGAYLTSLMVADPRLLPRMVRRLPAGVRHMLAGNSPKNARIEDDYPRELVRAERLGVLQGPLKYGLSRLDTRRAARGRARVRIAPGAPSVRGGAA